MGDLLIRGLDFADYRNWSLWTIGNQNSRTMGILNMRSNLLEVGPTLKCGTQSYTIYTRSLYKKAFFAFSQSAVGSQACNI